MQPNILFINTDQQTWNAISGYGNPYVETPNINRMLEHGMSFMRSYCTDPVCAAARASWVTGLHSSETGVPFNGGSMHPDIPDLGQILNANGYNAYHAGKWHVDGRNVRDSFQCLYFGQRYFGAGGAEFHDPVTTRSAIDFLSRYDEDKPFYLQVGLVNPHDVCEYQHSHERKFIPDGVELGLLDEADLPPLPENFDYDARETVTQIVARRGTDPLILKAAMNAADNWTEHQWRYLLWQLYRFVEKVDIEIGLILNALEASPFKEDTLLIFSVDHGESAGQHGLIQKFTLYEESIRTPFVVASFSDRLGIAKNSRNETHFVSGVDFLPTVLDYAGITPPVRVSGYSVRPWVEGQTVAGRDHAYIECNIFGRALVGQQYKYVTEIIPKMGEEFIANPDATRLGIEQLFDLHDDPGETRNIASDPDQSGRLASLRNQLLATESRLHRRPLCAEHSRNILAHWSKRISDYWQTHRSSPG